MEDQSMETVIGLEVHIQLNTLSKAFAADKNMFTQEANTHVSAITLGLPGTLPKTNRAHIDKSIALALALQCHIEPYQYFDRKNYFYPDLPKGYQITQDKQPIARGGQYQFLSLGKEVCIRIHHIHMEEDAGKSNHDSHNHYSLIEYNRAGTPLIELVTEPDFRSGQEVHDFLASIQQLVQYLEISDGNMEEGSIRCDCNVSVRPLGQKEYGERCEIKNVNSKRFAKEAIEYESSRQIALLKKGNSISKTTMLFDPNNGETRPMRKKETENDYRYFPEPDLSPLKIDSSKIEAIRTSIQWLPWTMKAHLSQLGIAIDDVEKLSTSKDISCQFLKTYENTGIEARELANLFTNKVLPYLTSEMDIASVIEDDRIKSFVEMYNQGHVSKSNAWSILWPKILEEKNEPVRNLAEKLDLLIAQNQDNLDEVINEVLTANIEKVSDYKKGKKGLIGFFMGQVKLKAGNNVNPILLKEKVEKALEK